MVNSTVAVCNGSNFNHMTRCLRAIGLRIFSEGSFIFTDIGQKAALNNDFALYRNLQINSLTLDKFKRFTKKRSCNFKLINTQRCRGLRRQKQRWVYADSQCNFQGFPFRLSFAENLVSMARQ